MGLSSICSTLFVPIGRRQREHRRLRATKIVCSDRAFTHVRYSPPRANRRRESALPGNNIRSPEIARRRTERGDRAEHIVSSFRFPCGFKSPFTAHPPPHSKRAIQPMEPSEAQSERTHTKRGNHKGPTSRASAATEASTSAALKRTNAPSQAAGCSRSHVAAPSVAVGQSSIAALATLEK